MPVDPDVSFKNQRFSDSGFKWRHWQLALRCPRCRRFWNNTGNALIRLYPADGGCGGAGGTACHPCHGHRSRCRACRRENGLMCLFGRDLGFTKIGKPSIPANSP
jgi:hypothetical protein